MIVKIRQVPLALLITASGLAFAAQEAAKPGDPPNIPMGTQANKPGAQTTQPSTPGKQPPKQDAARPPADSATQQAPGDSAAQMKSLDRDGDGRVTKTEANAMKGLGDSFDMSDKNKDGKLDAAEFSDALSHVNRK